MDYTTSNAYGTHPGTGNRMHQSDQPVTTMVSDKDLNMVIWSLMEVLKAAGVEPAGFDPDDETTYTKLVEAVQTLGGGGGGVVGGFVGAITGIDVTGMTNGAHVLASGRNTPGDGGGGLFVYASGSTATIDNVVVFAPAVGPGRLRREGWTTFGFTRPVHAAYAGVFGNGGDESAAIQAAWDAGYTLQAAAGRTYIAKGLLGRNQNTGFVCPTGRAKIKVPAGNNLFGLHITVPNFTWSGIDFDGDAAGPYNVIGATEGSRDGLRIGGTGLQIYNVTVNNCDITGFSHRGYDGLEVLNGNNFGKRVMVHNVNAYRNYQNWNLATGHEYVTLSQCYGYEGYIGIAKAAGNVSATACDFERNWFNCMVNPGLNNSHGGWVNCSFNHAMFIGLKCYGVEYGEIFDGCRFWYSPIQLEACTGVFIRNGQIAGGSGPEVVINGGGINGIDNNYTPQGLSKTFIGTVFTSFRGNRTTAADTAAEPVYGDVFMRSRSALGSSFAFPIAWNSNADNTMLPLNFETKKWHGKDAAFLELSGAFAVPRTGQYEFQVNLNFDNKGSAERITLRLSRYAGGGSVRTEFIQVSDEFSAGRTSCSLSLSRRLMCYSGDGIRLELQGVSSAGIEIKAGGIDVQITSVDH